MAELTLIDLSVDWKMFWHKRVASGWSGSMNSKARSHLTKPTDPLRGRSGTGGAEPPSVGNPPVLGHACQNNFASRVPHAAPFPPQMKAWAANQIKGCERTFARCWHGAGPVRWTVRFTSPCVQHAAPAHRPSAAPLRRARAPHACCCTGPPRATPLRPAARGVRPPVPAVRQHLHGHFPNGNMLLSLRLLHLPICVCSGTAGHCPRLAA